MTMWLAIFGAVLIFAISGAVYIVCGFHRFSFIKKLGEKHRIISWIVSAIIAAFSCGIWAIINVWSVAVIMIHLFIIWLICDIITAIIRKIRGKKTELNISGAVAIVITAVYLILGWYFAHHIFITKYNLTSDKNTGNGIRIVLIADSHLGTTLNGEQFAKQVDRIQALEPDMVVIAGDFVDDESKKADMEKACEALGNLNTTYGVFYGIGNHDRGYYSEQYRDFSFDDLCKAFNDNGIHYLIDETTDLGNYFCVIGRNDNYDNERKSIADLINSCDSSKYQIVIDHQPNDYKAESDAEVDLVLSGHTHGGPLIPAGQIGLLIGANDALYGLKHINSTDFIVTSGISTWAIPFKTGTISEIVVIDVGK